MSVYVEAVIAFLLVVAGIFGLVGSLGLVKLDDTMRRLHAPTKATTIPAETQAADQSMPLPASLPA